MRTFHLCAGHGGGLLADLILGHSIVGAVERDEFAQRVLRARQASGHLPAFPIFDDVRTFDGTKWRGTIDVVAGGIPCQGFSGAGKQLGEFDPRNLWPDAYRILRETRAPWFFLENVANLTSFDYWGVILQDLAAAGYDARWCVLSAGDVGAPHLRKRIWLLATDTASFRRGEGWAESVDARQVSVGEHRSALADALREGPLPTPQTGIHRGEAGPGPRDVKSQRRGGIADVADAVRDGCDSRARPGRDGEAEKGRAREAGNGGSDVANANGDGFTALPISGSDHEECHIKPCGALGHAHHAHHARPPQREGEPSDARPEQPPTIGTGGESPQPDLGGMADGMADRLDRPGWWARERGLPRVAGKQPHRDDRLRGCGNGQVALCAAAAWRLLGGPINAGP